MVTPYAFRLNPGEDLKKSISRYTKDNVIVAGCVLSCVGSLSEAVIRMADGKKIKRYYQELEIVSLTGTLSR